MVPKAGPEEPPVVPVDGTSETDGPPVVPEAGPEEPPVVPVDGTSEADGPPVVPEAGTEDMEPGGPELARAPMSISLPEEGCTKRQKCCKKSIPMIGNETCAKRKFHLKVRP